MNVAIYGGTFDPPTKAHEKITAALAASDLFDEVWIMPSADRIDKPHMSAAKHRMAMVAAMVKVLGLHNVIVSDFEVRIGEPTQTRRTYAELKKAYPNISFWFVFGADSFADMPNWEDGAKLQKTIPMCIVPRIGFETPTQHDNIHILPVPEATDLHISSTLVRQQAHKHESLGAFVSKDVQVYVLQHMLYD